MRSSRTRHEEMITLLAFCACGNYSSPNEMNGLNPRRRSGGQNHHFGGDSCRFELLLVGALRFFTNTTDITSQASVFRHQHVEEREQTTSRIVIGI